MAPIVIAPHPVLRQPTKAVTQLDKRTLAIIRDMVQTLQAAKNPEGVGLAAPQIGLPLRIFLIRPLPDKTITVFINPEITKYSQRQQSPNSKTGIYEGCLSLPGHYAPLTRSMSITVKYQAVDMYSRNRSLLAKPPQAPAEDQRSQQGVGETEGESQLIEKIETFSGFTAHIIQHEMDHLNGILFIDRVLEQNVKLFQVKGQDWHEVSL